MTEIVQLQARLSSLRRGVRALFLWSALARIVLAVTVAVMLLVALDWGIHAERPVRLLLSAGALAGLALVSARALAPLRLRMGDEDLALAAEARFPELQDRLISALQLVANPRPIHSPEMSRRVIQEALEVAGRLPLSESVKVPRLGTWSVFAGGAALLFGALAWTSADFRTGLARLVGDRPWPSLYALDVQVAADRIARGEDLGVTATLKDGSRIPSRVVLHAEADSGEDTDLPLHLEEGAYRGRLERVQSDLTVWVSAGDFRSAPVHVKVLEKPSLSVFSIRVEPPAYTGLPAVDLPPNTGHLRALRGSKILVKGEATKALKGCALAFGKGEAVLAVGEGGKGFNGEFVVRDPDSYVFRMEDAEGLKADHPVSYQVTVIADQAPLVRLEKPGRDLQVLPTAKLQLDGEAQDDYGLAEGTLVVILNRGTAEEKEQKTPFFAAPLALDVKRQRASLPWDLAPYKLEPGRQIRYRIEVADRDVVSGPNIGRSQEYGITVVTRDEWEADFQRRLEEIASDLGRARDGARAVRTSIQELAAAKEDPALAARSQAAQLQEGRLQESVSEALAALEALQESAKTNGASDARRDQMLQSASDSLRDLSEKRIPSVEQDLRAGARGEAAALDRAAETQAGVVDELGKVQDTLSGAASFGELLKRLERLIDENQRILDRTARGGGAAPGEGR